LDLSRRGITELPPRVAASSGRLGLKVLSLAGNMISALPTWFSTDLPYLRHLDLSHNPLGDEAISKLGRNFGRTCRLLRHLNLSNCHLKTIPDPVFGILDLTVLILGEADNVANPRADECDDNTIYKLPERLLELKWLARLEAPNIMLLELPSSIGSCSGLTHLDVHSNSLYWLPDSICDLKNLNFLNASSNAIEMLPQRFCKLSSLRELRLAKNSITWLSEDLGEMKASLRYLDMYDNALDPEGAAPLKELSTVLIGVDLANNNVSAEEVAQFLDTYAHLEDNLRKRVCLERRRSMPLQIDRSSADDREDRRVGRWHDDLDIEDMDEDEVEKEDIDTRSNAEIDWDRFEEECWDIGPNPNRVSDEDPLMTAIDAVWVPPPSSPSPSLQKILKDSKGVLGRKSPGPFNFCPADIHAVPLNMRPDPLRRLLVQRRLLRPGGFYVQVQRMRTAPRLGSRTLIAVRDNEPPVRGQFDDAD